MQMFSKHFRSFADTSEEAILGGEKDVPLQLLQLL